MIPCMFTFLADIAVKKGLTLEEKNLLLEEQILSFKS